MRTVIDIPETQIKFLTAISKSEKTSRAEIVRRAIALYLETKKLKKADAFALWKDQTVDGLTYQKKVRSEW
jgi:metal-responsive CopG/Arc/MetJ family transcriptional regulator